MKIAIIGGLGFIGTNLYFLLNKNYKIIFKNLINKYNEYITYHTYSHYNSIEI